MIPNPRTSPDALSVSDGHQTVGYIIQRDASFFAFDIENVLLGEFKTQRAAVRAIPKRERAGNKRPTRFLERIKLKRTPRQLRSLMQRGIRLSKPPTRKEKRKRPG